MLDKKVNSNMADMSKHIITEQWDVCHLLERRHKMRHPRKIPDWYFLILSKFIIFFSVEQVVIC